MGIDIHAFPERLVDGRYETDLHDPYSDWRQRDLWTFFGWDNGVGVPPIADIAEERGIPADGFRVGGLEDDEDRAVLDGGSWLSVRELLDFDRDATLVGTFRMTAEFGDPAIQCEADPGAATEITFRRFLGPSFFDELARLAASGAERLVFFYG